MIRTGRVIKLHLHDAVPYIKWERHLSNDTHSNETNSASYQFQLLQTSHVSKLYY